MNNPPSTETVLVIVAGWAPYLYEPQLRLVLHLAAGGYVRGRGYPERCFGEIAAAQNPPRRPKWTRDLIRGLHQLGVVDEVRTMRGEMHYTLNLDWVPPRLQRDETKPAEP